MLKKIVELDFYQKLANEFINRPQYTGEMDYFLNTALGLTGESGEFADIVKKVRFHGHPLDEATRVKLVKELGDILWYIAQGCLALDVSLSEVAAINIRKLTDRHSGGKFSETASIHKDESKEATGSVPELAEIFQDSKRIKAPHPPYCPCTECNKGTPIPG